MAYAYIDIYLDIDRDSGKMYNLFEMNEWIWSNQ